jgi:hypothetical protein
MQTVELLLDAEAEAWVRGLWRRLHDAGLKSLATHPHVSNRPHLTLAVGSSVAGLPRLGLPVPVRLGPVRSLGRGLVLAADGPALRELQAVVCAALDDANPLHAPSSWVPHVSLALNMPPAQHDAALTLLGDVSARAASAVAARSWDTENRVVSPLTGGGDGSLPGATQGDGSLPGGTQGGDG